MPEHEDQQESTPDQGGYDQSMGDAGVGEEAYNQAPDWTQKRFNKMSYQRGEEARRADAAEQALAANQVQLAAYQQQMANLAPPVPAEQPTGLDKFKTPEALRTIGKKLQDYQMLSVDPAVSEEARSAAKSQLAEIDDVSGTIFDIQQRAARMEMEGIMAADRNERDAVDAERASQSALSQKLFLQYGQAAIDKTSDLAVKAQDVIQGWLADGSLQQDENSDFVLSQAYAQAAQSMSGNSRGGRGSDPRHSAIEGGGQGRDGSPDQSQIARLEQAAKGGDYAAGKKAQGQKLDQFINGLMAQGAIRNTRR